MLDIKFIRENIDVLKQATEQKNLSVNFDEFLEVDVKRRKLIQQVESLKAEQNAANSAISVAQGDEKQQAINAMKEVAQKVKEITIQLTQVEDRFNNIMLQIPNIIHPDVPVGKSESENVVVETVGEFPTFDFEPREHMEILEMHNMIDVERGVKLGGSRSYFLKNDAVLLEQALLQYALKKMIEKGFEPMSVPYLVNTDTMKGTGYITEENQDDAFHLTKDEKWLIATAEIPLTAYHSNEILNEDELPKKLVAMSPCFRREAGSYGKDTAGLYRVHQFQKVEQVVITKADKNESDKWLELIMQNAREMLDDLKIPYRVLQLCTGDLALGKYNSQDLECYMPSRKSYGETHSGTAFLDFQSRRVKMRYRTKEGVVKYCYTLNNTVVATPRILIAVIENFQQADGTIVVPEVLRPYMGKDFIGGKVEL